MQAVKINDLVVHFRDEGPRDGPVMVFSNSLGTDLRIWDDLIAHFPDFRVIRYDKRGHGLSQIDEETFSMGDLVSDVAGLLDHLGVRDTIFVGLSIGGLIAQGLAAERPNLVKGLVLADTAAKIGTEEMWAERIRHVHEIGLEAMSGGILERWFSRGFHRDRQDELEIWRAMLARTTVQGYAGCSLAISHTDLWASTARLTQPALVMVGRDDGATPPDLVRKTAEMMQNASFHIIPKAGHLPCIEQPDAMAGLIQSFWDDVQLGVG